MAVKRRAISKDEKMKRSEAILDAAAELLISYDYRDISIASIALKTGLAKGTIFLYFRTKEELFLQLQTREYKSLFEDINKRLTNLLLYKKKSSINEFVENITASIGNHPVMIRLIPILHVILEQNIDYKTALDFKRFLLTEIYSAGLLIERCLPFMKKNDGARFLLHLQVLLIGIIQMSNPAPIIRKVIETEKMEVFQINFEGKLSEVLVLLINGMKEIRKK